MITDKLIIVKCLVTGAGNANKRSVYEPTNAERSQQLVCTKTKAVLIVILLVLIALVLALIAAFARPGGSSVCVPDTTPSTDLSHTTTEPTTTDGKAFPWKSIRLPRNVLPLTYRLTLHPDLEKFKFQGDIAIKIEAHEATNFIVFHSKNLTISTIDLFTTDTRDSDVRQIRIKKNLATIPHEQVYLELEEKLVAGQFYKLKMKFQGELTDGLTGFYRSSYELPDGSKRYIYHIYHS